MCGIAGIINLDGAAIDKDLVQAMSATLSHRGPDGAGAVVVSNLGFGHCRLSIIDLSGGAQPMCSHDGTFLITFNGEIFNYIELRAELEKLGAKFTTKSDTEVIIEGFRFWREALFTKLNGQFAFAIYDSKTGESYLVRDRMGEKPLYFGTLGKRVVFASELKAIVFFAEKQGVKLNLDRDSLFDYLSLNYVPFQRTLIKEIRSLPARSFLRIKGSEIIEKEYLTWNEPVEALPEKDLVAVLKSRLLHSAKLRLRSDVPVGIFLSGGFDSTLAAWAASHFAKPKAFIAHFPDFNFSEKDDALNVCAKLGLQHEIVEIKPSSSEITQLIEKLAFHADTALADSSGLAVYLLSRETSKRVKVVLSGDGGDELFGGYLTYPATLLARKLGPFLRQLFSLTALCSRVFSASDQKVGVGEKLERFLRNLNLAPGSAHFAWNGMFQSAEKLKLLNSDFFSTPNRAETFSELSKGYGVDSQNPTLKSLMLADLRGYLCQDILAKVDRMTMANALEARPILMDPEIISLSAALPESHLLKGFKGKQIVQELFRKELPWYALNRKKQGFSIPIHHWFRTILKPLAQDLIETHDSTVFNKTELRTLFQQHISRKRNLGFELWGIVIFLLWQRKFQVNV